MWMKMMNINSMYNDSGHVGCFFQCFLRPDLHKTTFKSIKTVEFSLFLLLSLVAPSKILQYW